MKILEILLLLNLSTTSVKLSKMVPIEVKVPFWRKAKNSSKWCSKMIKICILVNIFSSSSDPWPYSSKILKKSQKSEKIIKISSKKGQFVMIFSFLFDFFRNFTTVRSNVGPRIKNICQNTHFKQFLTHFGSTFDLPGEPNFYFYIWGPFLTTLQR